MRRELKYVVPTSMSATLVRARVPSLAVEFPPRQVSSVYFDTATYECYRQSNSGGSERMKLRLRWYGDIGFATASTLELKYRLNHEGTKDQIPLDPVNLRTTTWAAVREMMIARVRGKERLHVEALRYPILIANYWRHYLVTTNGRVRVTVDSDLRFYDQRLRPAPNITFDAVRGGFSVVECKMGHGVEVDEARILDPLGLRWQRFSKYCYGLTSLARL